MWIRTDEGAMLNLDQVTTIVLEDERINAFDSTSDEEWYPLATFATPALAQAAFDRLEKWIASDGEDGLPEVTQEGNATIVSPNWTQVFSFRTLSEDDEF